MRSKVRAPLFITKPKVCIHWSSMSLMSAFKRIDSYYIPLQTMFVADILFSRYMSVRLSILLSIHLSVHDALVVP